MYLAFKIIISKFYLFPLRYFSYLASHMYALPHKSMNIESYQFFLNDEGRDKSAKNFWGKKQSVKTTLDLNKSGMLYFGTSKN